MGYKLSLNKAAIDRKTKTAFSSSVLLAARRFIEAMSKDVYAWPLAPSPRDIVDTGQLRASQSFEFKGKLTAVFTWNTEYANAVYYGVVLKNGRILPGRPWVQEAFKKEPFQALFQKAYLRS